VNHLLGDIAVWEGVEGYLSGRDRGLFITQSLNNVSKSAIQARVFTAAQILEALNHLAGMKDCTKGLRFNIGRPIPDLSTQFLLHIGDDSQQLRIGFEDLFEIIIFVLERRHELYTGRWGIPFFSMPIAGVKIFWPGLIILGVGVGIIGGFFGMGGAWMVTPGLNILGFPMAFAIGTDIAHMAGKSLISTLRHGKFGNVDYKLGIIMLVGSQP
jgi:hypothetical protein